jgi:hypothetical protein
MKNLPLYLFASLVIVSSCTSGNADHEENTPPITVSDSVALIDTAKAFFRWYDANMNRLAQIHMVNQVEGTPYSVDSAGCEQFLDELRKSGLVTEGYLNRHRADFQRYQRQFEAEPQTEGPPMGFDWDPVMKSQEPDVDLDSIPNAHIVFAHVANDTGLVDMALYYEFEVALLKDNGGWKVERILFVGDE